jgi:Tol biopolymer transport system component
MHSRITRLTLLTVAALVPAAVQAQYFGQNKVTYRNFDFREMHTQHFDVYYYPAESIAVTDAARMAERWYARHSQTMRDTFAKKPLLFYSDAPAFSQQNIVEIPLGGATGGVTEPLRNRAILPMSPVPAMTDHVLGHELVHVFQYDIAENNRGPGGGYQATNRIPLWAIEGMAEYLSLGRDDPNSAMYLRDAVERKDIPQLRKLGRDFHFIYRWGQIFWAYVGGKYGDDVIPRIWRQALRTGWEPAVRSVLGVSSDSLSREEAAAIRREVTPQLNGLVRPENVGHRLLQPMSSRFPDIDLGPAVSPDGKYVSFFTLRGLFQIDLYVADVETGKIVHKLTTINSTPHFDALNFGGSGGSWSPDSKHLAVGVYSKGKEMIGIFNTNGGLERKIDIPQVTTAEDIAWSNEDKLAFSGSHGGISDLYVYDMKTGQTTQLTDDKYADIQPAWSPDGKLLAYVTDSGTTDFDKLKWGQLHIVIRDMTTGVTRQFQTFANAKAISPQFAPDGKSIYFIADRNGISDVYKESIETGEISQITRIATGVQGILPQSAALSVASRSGRLLFDVFIREGYELHSLDPETAGGTPLIAGQGDTTSDAVLPPTDVPGGGAVTARVADATTGLPPEREYPTGPYHPAFGLEYLGSPGVGVAVGGPYGTGLAGGISAYFGDQLENNVIAAQLAGSGQIQQFGGEVLYINQSHRLIYGAAISHIPYLTGGTFVSDTNLPASGGGSVPAEVLHEVYETAFYETAQLFAQYPFSQYRRLELGFNYTYLHYQITQDEYITDQVGNILAANYNIGFPGTPPGLNLWQGSLAYTTDYSTFGFTAPIAGARYRIEADPTFGNLLYTTVLADYRRYIFANPVTFAFRMIHYGRYGRDAEDSTTLYPLYVGDPYFIRGYDYNTFNENECTGPTVANGGCPALDRLFGSKMVAANFEIRFPVTGFAQYGLINFPYLPITVAPFFDAGVAWYDHDTPVFKWSLNTDERVPVFSTGISTRVNVLGYLVAEIFWAYPFQRPMQKSGIWGFQLLPGW